MDSACVSNDTHGVNVTSALGLGLGGTVEEEEEEEGGRVKV